MTIAGPGSGGPKRPPKVQPPHAPDANGGFPGLTPPPHAPDAGGGLPGRSGPFQGRGDAYSSVADLVRKSLHGSKTFSGSEVMRGYRKLKG